jgi:hypothetical protein
MIQSDEVEDLDWKVDGGKESVVDTYTTHLDLVRTTHTVFGDQCTERCCETFLTDFEAITHVDHYIDAKALWDCVTKGEVYYGTYEDTDYRSGDVSTHNFFFGSVEGMECDDCDDYPRQDEGDEISDDALHAAFDEFLDDAFDAFLDNGALHAAFDAFLDEANDEIDVAGITFSPSFALKKCDENAYETEYNDWLDGEVSGEVYIKRDGRYYEKV